MECLFEDLKDCLMIAFYSIYRIPLRLMIQLVLPLELTSLSHFSSKIYNFEGFKDRCPGGIVCVGGRLTFIIGGF